MPALHWDWLLTTARQRLHWAWVQAGPRVAVCWTGGKDSTVLLHLWCATLAEKAPGLRPRAIVIDTGWKFPETIALCRELAWQWDVDLHIVSPPQDCGVPVAVDPVACCHARKIVPLRRAVADLGLEILMVGVRADEHPDRAASGWQWPVDGHWRLAPLLEWQEQHIWTYHVWAAIPWCSLYDDGYRSLGCIPCTRRTKAPGERAGRDPRKETHMTMLRSLGYF